MSTNTVKKMELNVGRVLRSKGAMSIRGPKRAVSRPAKLKNFRCPDDVDAYLKSASAQLGRDQTDLIVGAIELDRDLSVELGSDGLERLRAFAEALGVSIDDQPAKAIALAVRKALDAEEAPARKPKK